jgi:hypothetical protein
LRQRSEISDDQLYNAAHPVTWVTVTSPASAVPARKQPGKNRGKKAAVAAIGLTVAARIVRDRRTYERLALLAVAVAAAGGAARSGASRSWSALVAWDKAQDLAAMGRAKAKQAKKSVTESVTESVTAK